MMTALQSTPPRLDDLLDDISVIGALPEVAVHGLAMDSREIEPGDTFLACAAGHGHGHGLDYIKEVQSRGATLVLAEISSQWLPQDIHALAGQYHLPMVAVNGLGRQASRIAGRFYGHPSRHMPVIGITGTNGKTSTCQYVAQAFEGLKKVGLIGTLGNGFLDALEQGRHTTPDPVSVQRNLAGLHAQGAAMVAMEVSSHALHQGRVADLTFEIAVLTNFSRDHLDYHGSMASYASAKSLLFRMPGLKSALINADDELGLRLIEELQTTPVRVIAFGENLPDELPVDSRLQVRDVQATSSGLACTLDSSWGERQLRLPLLGRFNIHNALVALGVLLEYAVPLDQALACLQKLRNVTGRMQLFTRPQAPTAVVDFAHTPDALEQVLNSLRPHVNGRLICVFGCGGDRDRGKRPLMGRVAEACADKVILTSDNPRSENPQHIIAEILQGMQQPQKVTCEVSREQAIRLALQAATAGDLVLVAGKGHEQFQQVGDLKLPFSDQQQVAMAMEARWPA